MMITKVVKNENLSSLQMFLTSSPASALSDNVGNRGTFHKTNDCLLFGSLVSTVSS